MSLTERINEDIKKAMLAREKEKLEALRAVKSALLLAVTSEGSGGQVTEDAEIKILQKLVKQRKETAEIYHQQGRKDLEDTETFQADIISAYLPSQMDETALKAYIGELIKEMGASGMKDMGKVVNAANQKLAGKAESKTIAMLVKSMLQ
ncbi:MAG: GatB/YqeY domain-containing protein [Omnitrophica WOR_2 bacterium]